MPACQIEVCTNCRPQRLHPREFDVTWLTKYKQHETGRLCTVCQQPLVDTIVHFKELGGERAPQVLNWSAAMRQAADADTIICLGSSLAVLQHYNDLWKRKKAVPLVANANSGNSQETSPADAQPASATLATATSPSAGTEPSQALSEVDAPPVANNTNVKSEATPELGSLTSDDPLPVDNPSSSSDGTPSEPQPGSSEPSSSQAEWSDSSTSASQASSSSLLPSERTTRRHRLAIVNLQWTPRDRYADIKIHARCDFVMAGLMQRLGLVASVYSRDKDPLFRTCIPLTAAEEALVWRDVQERLSEKRRHESESEAVAATESSLAAWQPNTEKSSSTNSLMLEYQTLQQLLAQPLLHDPSVISEAATRFQNVQLQLTALAPNPSSLGVGFLPQETGNTVSFGAAPGSSFLASAVVPLAPAWLGSTVSRKKPRLEPS
ncbi:hypothetical protein CAOG_010024 [Capsaspora owczarzaki ATCC 30864]|uniref:Deacetylase sirtuin-type domain-containing protein n=1 Tax=Capsaspora owczarzaki (strain ATCC 30864) TaxID=595528 RepID=A0A0D2WUU7_CAPO3|nr:hypothetical protein CAOG_010024 [Capsaspora owczarzaki ATCC 30864]